MLVGGAEIEELGVSVAAAGDVNGDGYADIVVGAPFHSDGESFEGAFFVYHGGPAGVGSGDLAAAEAQVVSNQEFGNLGISVASAGDVNADGYSDVIAGAPQYADGQTQEGGAFVFHGGASGIGSGDLSGAEAVLESNLGGAQLGASVASAGDVNGDGYADVLAGAPAWFDGQSNEGGAFLFLGGPGGVADGSPATAAAVLQSNQMDAGLTGVAPAGDVNGDGYADVIVGASGYDAGELNEGAAFLFLGNGGVPGRPLAVHQKRGDGSFHPVQPWGASGANGRFGVEVVARHPDGAGRVRPELEACPAGVAFGDGACSTQLYPVWVDVGPGSPEIALAMILTDLASDELYRWRARVQHAPALGPLPANPPHGPWRRATAQVLEADVRTIPEPGALLQLGVALAALALRARWRWRAEIARPERRWWKSRACRARVPSASRSSAPAWRSGRRTLSRDRSLTQWTKR